MGSPTSEEGRRGDETLHKVTLTHDFWMGETQVTQEQWKSVMDSNPSCFSGGNLPAEQMSWNDCREFVKKLNESAIARIGNKSYRFSLPAEAQWEYACRAGNTTMYCFGDEVTAPARNLVLKGNPKIVIFR